MNARQDTRLVEQDIVVVEIEAGRVDQVVRSLQTVTRMCCDHDIPCDRCAAARYLLIALESAK